MRPAIHPNRPPLHVGADELLDRNHFLRVRILFLPQAELERTALEAGYRSVVLNSGGRQPEALALYAQLGYRDVPGYGIYADAPDARFLGKDLLAGARAPGQEEERPWGS